MPFALLLLLLLLLPLPLLLLLLLPSTFTVAIVGRAVPRPTWNTMRVYPLATSSAVMGAEDAALINLWFDEREKAARGGGGMDEMAVRQEGNRCGRTSASMHCLDIGSRKCKMCQNSDIQRSASGWKES